MKLNCDMGESFGAYTIGRDADVMPHVHMANIACGSHAGDPLVMEKTVAMAVKHKVMVGAHPGYPDLEGFGRRNMDLTFDSLRTQVLFQVSALAGFCRAAGSALSYVKPHGAMYNAMMKDDDKLKAICEGVSCFDPDLPLMIQATPRFEHHRALAKAAGMELILEAFADRAYEADGSLRDRRLPEAVHTSEKVVEQTRLLCQEKYIQAYDGSRLEFPVDALCVHGDTEAGISMIKEIRKLVDAHAG